MINVADFDSVTTFLPQTQKSEILSYFYLIIMSVCNAVNFP